MFDRSDNHRRLGAMIAPAALLLGLLSTSAIAQTFDAGSPIATGSNRHGIEFADIDGDGHLDFATGGTNVGVFWGNGDLTGTFQVLPSTIQPFAAGGVATADFDLNGKRDIVAANGVGAPIGGAPGILFHWNQGARTFTQQLVVTTPDFGTSKPVVGDLDGDGSTDLVFLFSIAGMFEIWMNDGIGAFTPDGSYPQAGSSVQDMALADVDNDGDLDLASGQFFGGGPASVRIRRNDGSGLFGADEIVSVGATEANGIEFADMDSDGDLDLLVARPDIDSVGLLTNDGSGSFAAPVTVANVESPWDTLGEDFNNDGLADVALSLSTGPGSLGAVFNQGAGTFGGGELHAVGNLPFELGHGDMDKDGDQDVVVVNFANFTLFENLTVDPDRWSDLGGASRGVAGEPRLVSTGSLVGGSPASVTLTRVPSSALMLAWISFAPAPFPALGGIVHAFPFSSQLNLFANTSGSFTGATTWPLGVPPGTEVSFQFLVQDVSSIHGITLSNALRASAP